MKFDIAIRVIVFVSMFGLMASWEAIAPRRKTATLKVSRWIANLSVAVLNTMVIRILMASGAVGVAMVTAENGWGILNMLHWPVWIEIVLAVLLLDLMIYLQHLGFHAVPVLWKIHMVHHADPDYDVTTAVRFHPVEALLSMVLKMAGVTIIGASPTSVLAFEIILNGMAMFNHANVRMPAFVDWILRWVVVTPDMHRIHHSIFPRENNRNFGFNLPWWDYMFGTYLASPSRGHDSMTFGLKKFRSPACLKLLNILKLPFGRSPGIDAMNQGECL
jgi:sterol desaturase/sphingolipid hydroxylase (fatty acid hydroxylase superfamily)